jgi:Ca2+-binding RTX toxin-like protein
MTTFMANADLYGLFQSADVVTRTSTTFKIRDASTGEVLTLTGSFVYDGSSPYPYTGTITGGSYSPGNLAGFAALAFSGASISVEDFTFYVEQNDITGLFRQILAGADELIGSAYADELYGFAGNDLINGKAGADKLFGGLGNDTFVVDNGSDRIVEAVGEGADTVRSSVSFTLAANVERLTLTGTANVNGTGNSAANIITGNGGANSLSGLGRSDTIKAGGGNDTLKGGAGSDRLTGGGGADKFVFDTALSASSNVDRLLDYSVADDTVVLDQTIFSAIASTGTLSAGAFRAGTAAADAGDRIIYDSATGKIYYDADGNGAGAKVLFATVTAGTALTNADFQIVG